MPTSSERLRRTIALVSPPLTALIREVWFHPRLGELYPEFLFALYGVTASSAPAMRVAADRCSSLGEEDSFSGWLRSYLLEHADEEQGHEGWIENDLASFGIARSEIVKRMPYASVAALVGAQYYWMMHVHPVAYLGYIAVLEAPTAVDFLEEVSERTGLPLASMSAHVLHAKLDPDHVAEFDRTLDLLPLTDQHRDLITVSAITTVAHLQRVFSDILEHFGRINALAVDAAQSGAIFTTSRAVLA